MAVFRLSQLSEPEEEFEEAEQAPVRRSTFTLSELEKERPLDPVNQDIFSQQLSTEIFEPTTLEPEEEAAFQAEFRTSPWFQAFKERHGDEPKLIEDGGDFDYRAAWQTGALDLNDPNAHGFSRTPDGRWLKNPQKHQTAWKELFFEKTGRDPDADGLTREQAAKVFTETPDEGLTLTQNGDPEADIPHQRHVDFSDVGVLDSLVQFGAGAGEFIALATTDLAGALAGTVAAVKEVSDTIPSINPAETLTRLATGQSVRGEGSTSSVIAEAPDLINFMRDTFRYEPESTGGQTLETLIGGLFESVAEGGEKLGDLSAEAGLPPAVSTAARIGPEALIMLAPFALRGKNVQPLAQEVIDAKAKAAAANKRAGIFTRKKQDALEADQLSLEEIKAKPITEVTPAESAAIPELTRKIQEASTELAAERGLDYVRVTKTDQILNKATDVEIQAADLGRVQELVRESNEAVGKIGAEAASSAKPIEVIVDGARTTITSGLEELIAAKILGEKTVQVRTVLPNPKAKSVKAMADKVNRISEEARILSEKIKNQSNKTIMEKVKDQYSLSQNIKDRIKKNLPNKEWVPTVLRYEQMQNAGTSANLFAKDFFEPVFKKVTGRHVYNRQSGGKTIAMTDEMLLDEIVQSRLVQEITQADRRPNHKFAGKATRADHQARLRQLEQELGPDEFGYINDIATEVFSVYKKLLNKRRSEGLITPELHRKLEEFDYSPIEHLEFFDPEIASQSGKGVRSSGVLKLKDGSYDLTQMSSRELLHDSINRTYNIIARNRVLAELDNAIRSNPTSGLAQHVKILKTPKKGKKDSAPKADAKGVEEIAADATAGKLPRGFERVEFFNQGKKRALAIDPYIASVWKTSGELEGLRVGAGVLRTIAGVNLVKALAVGVNPAFPLIEIPRNMIGVGFSNGTSLSGVPLFGARSTVGQSVLGLPISAGQFARNMAKVAKDAREHGPFFRELADNNAFPRFLAEVGLDAFKSVNRPEGLAGKLLTENGAKYLNRVAEAWSYPGIYAETVMRMAVARQAKLRGLTPLEQAGESLRMVNFNEAGHLTSRVDSVIPFFNAGFQASRAQFRGFQESPVRTAALATSVMTLGFTNYMSNWFVNPDAVSSISDEHLATGFNFVLPKFLSGINPEGEIIHPYIHIPADGAAIVPLALSAWTMRRFNEKREPSGMLLSAITGSTFPLLDLTGAPLADATLAVLGNYDRFRGRALFPQDVGEPFQEYYGEHERNHTPGFYVEAGRILWEQGLLQDTPIEGLASPERLRAAVNAYLPGHPISNSFSALDPLLDPESRELYISNWELLDKTPFVGRLLNVTNPNINPWSDMDEAIGELQAQRAAAKRSVDEMAFEVAKGSLSIGTALSATQTRFQNIDPEYRDRLSRRLVVSSEAQKIFQRLPKARKLGVPGVSWWASLGATANPRDRARGFYASWIQAGPKARASMENIALKLSSIGGQHKIMDADGEYFMELNRLKRTHGTDFVPGILLNDVDYDALDN